MVTIICMCMIVYLAGFVVNKMGGNDQHNSWYKQPCFISDKKLFQYQEQHTRSKKRNRQQAVVMFLIAMIKRI